MQTFLPYTDFVKSAECLDRQRLGKQRVECLQILRILIGEDPESRWKNHSAVKMWKGYEYALCIYSMAICHEWIRRGYRDTCLEKFDNIYEKYSKIWKNRNEPNWCFDENFHLAHQSNLVRKFSEHYRKYFPDVSDNLSYIWPVWWNNHPGNKMKRK